MLLDTRNSDFDQELIRFQTLGKFRSVANTQRPQNKGSNKKQCGIVIFIAKDQCEPMMNNRIKKDLVKWLTINLQLRNFKFSVLSAIFISPPSSTCHKSQIFTKKLLGTCSQKIPKQDYGPALEFSSFSTLSISVHYLL